MIQKLKRFCTAWLDVIYPRICPVCRDVVTPKGELVCPGCRERLPYIEEPSCLCCGKPIASEQEEYCNDCAQKKFSYERSFAVFLYDDVMQQAVADFKYRSHKELAAFFAEEMSQVFRRKLSGLGAEALVPVPVHPARKTYRGYNQAEEISRLLMQQTGIPMLDLLVRKKKTTPQKELDAADRLRNLESAIALKKETVQGEKVPHTVVLVDDIYTTGSTAEACARTLLRGGISNVYVFSLCIVAEQ